MKNGMKTKGIVVVDLSGWSIWMVSYLSYLKSAVDVTQNQFPERLRRVMLFNAPYIFRGAWLVIKPFIDKKTVSKFVFVTSIDALDKELNVLTTNKNLFPIAKYGGGIEDIDSTPAPGF